MSNSLSVTLPPEMIQRIKKESEQRDMTRFEICFETSREGLRFRREYKLKLSATERLISIVYEHKELLGFLNEKHPSILVEWKNKGAELAVQTPQTTDDSNHQSDLNGNYRDN